MSLREFVEKFVCKNTLVKLWKPVRGGHKMIVEDESLDDSKISENYVCMEWEILGNKVWQSKYLNCNVIGVKDIVCHDDYSESVNIVIDVK